MSQGDWPRRYKSLCLIKAGELGMKVRRRGKAWEICKGQLLKVCERPLWAWKKRTRLYDSRESAIKEMLYIVNDWAMDHVEADRPCCLVELWFMPHWFVTPGGPNRTFKVGITKAEALDMVRSDEGTSKTATSPAAKARTRRAKCSENPDGRWSLHHSFCQSR